jgi:hypothetical protein
MIQLERLKANARPIYVDRKPTGCQTNSAIRKEVLQPTAAFDEALWAHARRSEKGVTEELFHHSLVQLVVRNFVVAAQFDKDSGAFAPMRSSLITAAAQSGGNQALAETCEDHFSAATCFAHCQNFSAAGLSRLFGAAIPMESAFCSGVSRKSFTRCPKA